MKNKCYMILTRADHWPTNLNIDLVGIDRGALLIAKKKQRMKLAVGDFDSINEEEMKLVESYADEIIKLNPIKDDSDFEAALKIVYSRGYEKVYAYGALGGRLDHALVNQRLCYQYPEKLVLLDDSNVIQAYGVGTHIISKNNYKYCSFFARSKGMITLKGMKYPLDHCPMEFDSLFTVSNEILGESGILEVLEGTILSFQTND